MPDPAADRPLPGEDSRLYRIGVMLLNGYGYNWYRLDNQMRADDLLVRSRASEHLESAASRLHDLEGRYRSKYLPPPTREHPEPDPQHLAAARRFRAIADRILEIDTRLRGAAVPPDDKIWRRQRGEFETLQQLGKYDVVLVADAKELVGVVADLPAEIGIDPSIEQQIDRHLGRLAEALTGRNEILAVLR
ncbi:MAG: hypothetical protein JO160_02330 [Candidatus Eremiobacteraeota bacterium]|nr:hypothetical protein [Candidatus Eremiobacteraeota bacterium]